MVKVVHLAAIHRWRKRMTPDEIAARMTGQIEPAGAGPGRGVPASPVVHNHAAFLQWLPDGTLACAWFGGTLEGRSDIFIHLATLAPGADGLEPGRPGLGRSRPLGAEPGDLHRPRDRRPGPVPHRPARRAAGGVRGALPAAAARRRRASGPASRGRSRCRRAASSGPGDAARRRRLDAAAVSLPHGRPGRVGPGATTWRRWRRAPTAARPGTSSRCRGRPAACT